MVFLGLEDLMKKITKGLSFDLQIKQVYRPLYFIKHISPEVALEDHGLLRKNNHIMYYRFGKIITYLHKGKNIRLSSQ